MTNVLITKNTFSRVKKSLKSALNDKFGLDPKLSEVSQVLANALGFESEHELQKHFEKESTSSASQQKNVSCVQDPNIFIALDVFIDNDAYFNARSNHPESVRLDHPILLGHVHVLYNTDAEGVLNRPDACRKTVYAKASDLVEAANASRHGDSHHIEIFWQKPGFESTLTKIEKVIANHFAANPPTAIQKLSFDYADYGLDLFVMAMNKANTDIEGFGFYYSDDISNYKQKEMDRLGLTTEDKQLIENLIEASGLAKSNAVKEQISSELKYEIADKLGLKNMNSSLRDESNYFDYDLYVNKDLINVISIYPHGLFKGKTDRIKINPNRIHKEKGNRIQYLEYIEEDHLENSVVLKLPVYTSYLKTNSLKFVPVSWIEKALKSEATSHPVYKL